MPPIPLMKKTRISLFGRPLVYLLLGIICFFALRNLADGKVVPPSGLLSTNNSVNATDSSNFSKTPREAAEVGFKRFLENESFNKQIGFSSTAEALSSVIGEGFQKCYIKTKLVERTHSTSIPDIMGQYDSWEFAVMNQGQAKALVKVEKEDGHWKAVGLGGPVGDAMQEVVSFWPASAGYSLRLIYGQPLRMNSLVVVSKAGVTVGVVILSFTMKNGVVADDPVKLSSEKDAINYIKETLKKRHHYSDRYKKERAIQYLGIILIIALIILIVLLLRTKKGDGSKTPG